VDFAEVIEMKNRTPAWLGLMFSTAILLTVCGIPGAALASLAFWLNGTMNASGALTFLAVMVGCEVVIAGALWLVASQVNKLTNPG
jgi:hypothetical protein